MIKKSLFILIFGIIVIVPFNGWAANVSPSSICPGGEIKSYSSGDCISATKYKLGTGECVSISLSCSGKCGTSNVTVNGNYYSVTYKEDWHDQSGRYVVSSTGSSSADSTWYYDGCSKRTDGKWECSGKHTRCGSIGNDSPPDDPTPTPTPEPDYACWRKGDEYWYGNRYDPNYTESQWFGWERTNLSAENCKKPDDPSPPSIKYYCCEWWDPNNPQYKWAEEGTCDGSDGWWGGAPDDKCSSPATNTLPPVSQEPSETTYDYCCVNRFDDQDSYMKWDQTSKTCPDGYDVMDSCPPPRPSPECYAERTSSGIIYHWTSSPSQSWTNTGKTQSQCVNCYGDGKYLSLSKKVNVQGESSGMYPNVFPNVTNMNDCKVISDPPVCKPSALPVAGKTSKANICEDSISTKITEGVNCSGNAFYTINCTTDSTTYFDNGNDGLGTTTVNNLILGQGFSFGINIKTSKTCVGKFNGQAWKTSYDTITKKIRQVVSDCGGSGDNCKVRVLATEYYRLNSIREEIINIVKSYNNIVLNAGNDETAKLTINGYKVDNALVNKNENFEVIEISKGEGKYISRTKVELGVSGVTNPYNYTWTNSSKPREIKLVPTMKYINALTGLEDKDGIAAGNKVYIDYHTNKGEYTLNIEVNGAGGKNNKITNDKCKIKVSEFELLYRPIDVTNPFINKSWQKGANWINSEYDFTSTIKANTWATKSLLSVSLSADEIVDLKASTRSNRDQLLYYSLCESPSISINNQNQVTKKLCSEIKRVFK